MFEILEFEFKNRRTEYAANPLQFPFDAGELAIVEVEKGLDLGKISHIGFRPGYEGDQRPKLVTIRRANPADVSVLEQNRKREHDAKQTARAKIREHQLDMKLVDVELQWDGRKMTFYFTAEGRVDFRELVKDLAGSFRTRIDLRQIGARDETKKTGGYGICGRPLCCATFLTEFKPITTQMPRDQFLPLNPSKLSGVCGRLKCCLRYEVDVYREFQRSCPKVGHPVKDEYKGEGVIEKLDVIREEIQVRYGNGELDKTKVTEFREISNWRPEMPRTECICTCGKKQPAAKPQAEIEEEASVTMPEAPGGERVRLLAGGGLGIHNSEGAGIEVGTSLDTPAAKSKRKNRRSHGKKRGEGGEAAPTQAAAPTPAPAQPKGPLPPKPKQPPQVRVQPQPKPPAETQQKTEERPAEGTASSKHKRHHRGHSRGRSGRKPNEEQ